MKRLCINWKQMSTAKRLGLLGSVASILALFFTLRSCVGPDQTPHSPVYNIAGDFVVHQDTNAVDEIEESITKASSSIPSDITLSVYDPKQNKSVPVVPQEGKIYTTYTRKGARLDYMLRDGLVHVDYTSPDGSINTYYVADFEGNFVDLKLPYPIEEYSVIIPKNLELSTTERILPNGWKHVHVKLKWDCRADIVYDQQGKLKQLSAKGGCKTNHSLKRFVIGAVEKTDKNQEPNQGIQPTP